MNKINNLNKILIPLTILALAGAGIIIYLIGANGTLPFPIDEAVRDFFVSIRTDIGNILVIGLTHCGDTITIVVLCAILVILPTRKKYGFPVTIAALSGLAIYKPMKQIFLRERPDAAIHLIEQGGYSFPSGHSVSAVIVYGLLLYLIRRHCKNEKLKNILSVIVGIFAFFIGPSRLYVGVHWASDVVCGMLIGAAIVMIAIMILERIYKKYESLR